ncbi:MAG: XTP/dITP diphosphatase [candidate division WOR-3 bacterium]
MKLILASKNRHKILEIKSILKDFDWEIIALSDLAPDFTITEDGKTFEENAIKKAESVMSKFGLITLGEDTGLEVDILNGRPGIFSARYAGENASYEQNVKKLLAELRNIPIAKRTARFRCVCALAFPSEFNRKTELFQGICKGHIIDEVRGKAGFGYDPIFVPNGCDKTFAEMSAEEKNRISHRAKALEKVKKYLNQLKIV